MTTLRQRLLLVVGWVVAAVGIGLVSAGAVAVAGGQVTDRPLRPLSAAEVAALPITTQENCVTLGPLASGGSELTPCFVGLGSESQAVGTDESAQPAERESNNTDGTATVEPSPAPAGNPTASSDVDAVGEVKDTGDIAVASGGTDDAQLGLQLIEPQVLNLVGGEVRITVIDGGLVLSGASPRPGYVARAVFSRPDELSVTFWNGLHLSTLVADLETAEIEVTESETPS